MPDLIKNKETGRWEHRSTVAAGNSEKLYMPVLNDHKPGVVGVSPGAGGTALVEYTLSALDMVKADDASVVWRAWPFGDVSIDTDDVLDGPVTALRMTATTADAQWEVLV